jgi:hypothetical protein
MLAPPPPCNSLLQGGGGSARLEPTSGFCSTFLVRFVAMLAALLVLGVAHASAPVTRSSAASTPLLGVVWSGRDAQATRLDPSTLQPAGRRVSLGQFGAWVLSPERDRLAVGRTSPSAIRLVDVNRMKRLATVRLAPSGSVNWIAWLRPSRLVAVYAHFDGSWIAWVDTRAHRMLRRAPLAGVPAATASGGGRFVALLQPRRSIGTARLAVASAAGRLRVVRLPGIRIGMALPVKPDRPSRRVLPGLAVDPAGARAYVVGTEGVVSVVDLRSLAVATHRLREAASRTPAAAVKAISGPALEASWVGGGVLAVGGMSYRSTVQNGGERQFASPLGLRLVDVRTWRQRTIDPSASAVAVAGSRLLSYGVAFQWGGGNVYSGNGIGGYARDGKERFRVLPGQPVGWVQVGGGLAYGWLIDEQSSRHVVVVDAATGTVERDLRLGRPTSLLLGGGGSY